MNIITVITFSLCFYLKICASAPTRHSKNILLLPTRFNNYVALPYAQVRGPFDFIGNWIQSSEWFPIEINVPDTISGVGNGIATFATNVGTGFNTFAQNLGIGFQTFTQNVGNNVQNFAQTLSQRFPVFAVFVRPNAPPRYFILVPKQLIGDVGSDKDELSLALQQMDSDVLESFP